MLGLAVATCLLIATVEPCWAGCPYQKLAQDSATQLFDSAEQLTSWNTNTGSSHSRGLKQAPAPAPSVAGGCGLTVGTTAATYTKCTVLDAGTAFDLYYNLTMSGSSATLEVGIAATTSGWVGVGFPQSGQEMVGTDSVIAKADASSTTGATAAAYHMSAQNSAGVQPPAQYLNITGITASASGGRIMAAFTMTLAGTLAAAAEAGSLNAIYAVGPVSSSGTLQQHTLNAAAVISPQAAVVSTGQGQGEGGDSKPANYNQILAAHGWILAIGVGFLVPLGITIAKLGVHTRVWKGVFWLHVVTQVLGVIMGIVGIALGSQLDVRGELLKAHKGIGIAAVVAMILQIILAASWRPPPKSAKRWIYQSYHWWLGRAAVCLAIANVFIGLQSQAPDLIHYVIAYAVVIGVLFLIWLAAALVKWRFEPVFIPSKRYPAGKNANYEGTELAPFHRPAGTVPKGHSNGHSNGHSDAAAQPMQA